MRQRRFLILATVLVALAFVPAGLALLQPRVTVASLFGKNMMRADVTMNSGMEWRVDRGTVVSNVPGLLTLHETDGRVQPITTASSTKVTAKDGGPATLAGIKPGWHVLVIWPAVTGPADSIVVEKRHS